jgi:hypothetical protein
MRRSVQALCAVCIAVALAGCKDGTISKCKMEAMATFKVGSLKGASAAYFDECMKAQGYQWDLPHQQSCDPGLLDFYPDVVDGCWKRKSWLTVRTLLYGP